ncbi:MAG: NusG domain II-containing protein [Oscillospiraceae bacterium]|nr:NusG domain II-containing protein [Oscillospiraceae bacterium]
MKRGDILIALALLALAGLALLLRPSGAGGVYVNGEAVSGSVTINEVVIEVDGSRARVTDSPCRDKLCVHAGWLDRPGDVAVCLPQRVIVEIRGTARRQVDGVAG